jgi:adenylosuccinate lyase
MRETGSAANDLLDRLAADPRLPLDRDQLGELIADRTSFTGLAGAQVVAVLERIAAVVAEHPDAAAYTPGAIL